MGSTSSTARATLVVVARERFSFAREALQSIFEHTDPPYELIYVDAGSPRYLRRWLERESAERGFRLLQFDRFLSPNQSRNAALAKVDTEFAVFLDNDVGVRPGWLEKLIECADGTGAAAVGPLTCEAENPYLGEAHQVETVHYAGGDAVIIQNERGEMVVHDEIFLGQEEVEAVRSQLVRRQVSLVEFHCMMVRTEAARAIGGFDEEMLSTREHVDFSLSIADDGGTIWLEPESVVVWTATSKLRPSDLPFYMLRWSDEWDRRSLEHLQSKWGLARDENLTRRLQSVGHRRQSRLVVPFVRRVTLGRGSPRLEEALKRAERRFNRSLSTRHARQGDQGAVAGGTT